jgi:hypothetical protein
LSGPATGTRTTAGSMTITRAFRTLTQLQNGQVLAAASETQNHVGKIWHQRQRRTLHALTSPPGRLTRNTAPPGTATGHLPGCIRGAVRRNR